MLGGHSLVRHLRLLVDLLNWLRDAFEIVLRYNVQVSQFRGDDLDILLIFLAILSPMLFWEWFHRNLRRLLFGAQILSVP